MNSLADNLLNPQAYLSGSPKEVLLVLAAVLVVILGIVLWATFIRKPVDPTRPEYLQASAQRSFGSSGRRRRRRRRREHRPRNPTLAETGGLPRSREDRARTA